MSKPSIVTAHGIRADGSCFQKLIPTLRAEDHEVMAIQPPGCHICDASLKLLIGEIS